KTEEMEHVRSRVKKKDKKVITVFLNVLAALEAIADAIKGLAGRSNDGSQGVNCFPKGSHFELRLSFFFVLPSF
ncbi:hypothetical protein A4A49_29145, partial [Nicotiana attenuata]